MSSAPIKNITNGAEPVIGVKRSLGSTNTSSIGNAGGYSSASEGSVPKRRNGKQQACEPCRKAKIACDHSLPVCERCKRRRVVEKCVYLDKPMTKGAVPEVTGERSRSEGLVGGSIRKSVDSTSGIIRNGMSGRERDERRQDGPLTPETLRSGSVGGVGSGVRSPAGSGIGIGGGGGVFEKPVEVARLGSGMKAVGVPESGPFIKNGGFFGPTNFSAVFLENRNQLGPQTDLQITQTISPDTPSNTSLQSQTFLMLASQGVCSPRAALGIKVLAALPDQSTFMSLLTRYWETGHECTFPKQGILQIAESLWDVFGKEMKSRDTEGLERLSEMMCKNAEKALEDTEDYQSWLASITGENMRWEGLGMVIAALTTAILSLPDRDPFFIGRKDRRTFAVEMKDCVQACGLLSNYMDLINIVMVALLARNLILQTVLSGDASLVVWRQLGDLVSATTALGLHRQTPPSTATFMSEMRKRIFQIVYNIDKGSSLLTGRPPALSHRFTRSTLCLDIDNESLVAGGETLAHAVAELDANGWNTKGGIYPSTSNRAHGMLAPILNEVLELSLGDLDGCTAEHIDSLMKRIENTYNSYPSFYQFRLSDLQNPAVSDHTFWKRLCLRLIMLEHRLLLERLAHKQGFKNGQTMVNCAHEMLELTVLIWVQRDRFVEHHHDYDWMLMCWGVPSSGVLCVELLKQLRENDLGEKEKLRIPRSEIVQNLSLLIGFLEWVKPAAGNYQLCMRMRIIIKRILDQILNPSPPSSAEIQSEEEESRSVTTGGAGEMGQVDVQQQFAEAGFYEGNGWEDGLALGDNMEWLNNMDWSRGPWFDLGQDFSAARFSGGS